MKLLESSVMLFQNVPDHILRIGDDALRSEVLYDNQCEKPLDETKLDTIRKYVSEEIQEKVYRYFFEFEHADREDLKKWSYGFNSMKQGDSYMNWMRNLNYLNISSATAKMIHRGTSIYTSNFVKWPPFKGTGHFVIIIGLSKTGEHESYLDVPLQKVSYKMNRGDMVVFPAAISHPYTLNRVVNGNSKYIECL